MTLEYGAIPPPPKRRKLLAKTQGAMEVPKDEKIEENSDMPTKNEP